MPRNSSRCRKPRIATQSSASRRRRQRSAPDCGRCAPIYGSSSPTTMWSSSSTLPHRPLRSMSATRQRASSLVANFIGACRARSGSRSCAKCPPSVFDPAFTSVAKIDYALGIPLTHLAIADPVLPIYVNAYLPPQPSMERCYAFGQALARIVSAMGVTTVVLASGGMSHYPGTERYAAPDLAWDREALARIAAGNLKSLVGHDAAELDAAGNVELRCWACAAGALGERKPDIVSLEPSWHHNYASLGWFSPWEARPEPHYPSIKPELVELTVALHGLAHDEASRATFLADAASYADRFRLTAVQRGALIALDTRAIVARGAHPLVPFLASMQVERQRRG